MRFFLLMKTRGLFPAGLVFFYSGGFLSLAVSLGKFIREENI